LHSRSIVSRFPVGKSARWKPSWQLMLWPVIGASRSPSTMATTTS
jgi:hypothetical protein